MNFFQRLKSGIQIVVGGHSVGRTIVKGTTANSGHQRPKQGEEWLNAYNTMPWLRANVAKISQGVASLEWGITRTMSTGGMTIKRPDIQRGNYDYRRKSIAALEEQGMAEPIFDHPFLSLWKNPCPALPGGAARRLFQVYYEVVGEVFMVVDRGPRDGWIKGASGRALPTALWPVPPTWVKRFPTPDNPTFEIRNLGLQMNDVPMSEVLWLKDVDPVNPYGRGVGLFNSLKDELDADENAAAMISYSFYNRNRPDVLVTLPEATDQEVQAFRADWISNLQGISNTLKSHFVNTEAEVQQIGFDFREMQVEELRKSLRDTIRQIPGMPPEMLGIQDQSNRSTIEAAEWLFNKHLIEPRAEIWREFLSSQILIEYDDRAVLDYVSPAQEDKNFTASVMSANPEIFKVNEKRKLAGQSAIPLEEGGEMYFVNGAFVPSLLGAPPPAGMPGGPPSAPGSGGGLSHPGFDGGINVPGAPRMHLTVPGAAGSAESGKPAGAATPPTTIPAAPGTGPGFTLDFPIPKAPAAMAGGDRSLEERLARVDLSPRAAEFVAKWASVTGRTEIRTVLKRTPYPIADAEIEFARRALARIEGRSTKGWNKSHGAWTSFDDDMVSAFTKAFDPDQPRDESGKWTGGSNGGQADGAGSEGTGGGSRSAEAGDGGAERGIPPASRGRNLEGLPEVVKVDGKPVRFGGFKPAQDAAEKYAKSAGLPYRPPTRYAKVDPERSTRIAKAFDEMKHDPSDPEVKAAYGAMIRETADQYKAMMKTGLKLEFIEGDDPYASNPRRAMLDVIENNHLWVFPTDSGFGSSGFEATGNPMLAPTEFKISGKTALANDVFRAVHDYFGHIKEGVGFRADGEENAWRSHSAMYSKLARRAMTTETRGQNSWVNFGPHAEKNRGAKQGETVYADQKVGLLPEWITEEGSKAMRRGVEKDFNPDQPRDDDGKFASTGGGFSAATPTEAPADDEPGFTYHATSIENAEEILSAGALVPHRPDFGTDQDSWPDGSTAKRSYFIDRARASASFAPADGRPVLLRTRKTESFRPERGTGDTITNKPVLAAALEILGSDGKWHPISVLGSTSKGFDPNQARAEDGKWTSEGGGGGSAESEPGGSAGDVEAAGGPRSIATEPTTDVESPFWPFVDDDDDGDGVTDSARVGVPARSVPPPPVVPRLPNLTAEERAVESAFADAYQSDPDKMARDLLGAIQADPPAKFETDGAKNLFAAWKGDGMTPEERAEFRSTMNTALHQTANAVTKRAFLMHLDGMSDADKEKGVLVTVGGCGAGKGFALKTLSGQGFSDFNAKLYGAVWDSAGDQNATENPWILDEAEKRGVKVTYAYISSDPEVAWADPGRGVVQRADDPKDGRMVDASVFADSYVIGAKNHAAFSERNKDRARFVYVKNGSKIEKLDSVPKSDTSRDRKVLREFAVKTIEGRKVQPRIRRGALVGARIWKGTGKA